VRAEAACSGNIRGEDGNSGGINTDSSLDKLVVAMDLSHARICCIPSGMSIGSSEQAGKGRTGGAVEPGGRPGQVVVEGAGHVQVDGRASDPAVVRRQRVAQGAAQRQPHAADRLCFTRRR